VSVASSRSEPPQSPQSCIGDAPRRLDHHGGAKPQGGVRIKLILLFPFTTVCKES
jgi:hypothetical protein